MREAGTAAQPKSCPHKDHWHILATCFNLPPSSDAPPVALLLLWIGVHCASTTEKTEIIVASHLRLPLHVLSALLYGAHVSVWIFYGKPPRSGSLSPFARWLGSNMHTWKVSGGLSWCLLPWRHGDMQGHSQRQAGWLQNAVPLQIALCLEAHPVELEKKEPLINST